MFQLGVIVVAMTVLLFLTALAMTASARLGHPGRVLLALAATLVVGLVLILE
jgi:hypothetical protein